MFELSKKNGKTKPYKEQADKQTTAAVYAVTDFGVRLLQQNIKEQKNTNVLISPLSVICALAMVANGAQRETLSQMEEVFGASLNEVNQLLNIYMITLLQDDAPKLHLANAIWVQDIEGFTLDQKFLQTNMMYFNFEVNKAFFNTATLQNINRWVDKHTNGMIKEILDTISQKDVMYLVNALAFQMEWEMAYEKEEVRKGKFFQENGTVQQIELMYGKENNYLKDDNAEGFIKYYKESQFAFAALLPQKGIEVSEYADSLTGKRIQQILNESEYAEVETALPKFQIEYGIDLFHILQQMGIRNAFDAQIADFTGMGSIRGENLCIDRVIHKTFITVDEKGTKAAAATAVGIRCLSAVREEKTKKVFLDRPFVYMIFDCNHNLPLFIGTVMGLERV